MASEIILTVSERRNRQKLTLSSTAAPFVFGRGRDCSFVLRRNNVGEHQFTIEYKNNAWLMQDAGSRPAAPGTITAISIPVRK